MLSRLRDFTKKTKKPKKREMVTRQNWNIRGDTINKIIKNTIYRFQLGGDKPNMEVGTIWLTLWLLLLLSFFTPWGLGSMAAILSADFVDIVLVHFNTFIAARLPPIWNIHKKSTPWPRNAGRKHGMGWVALWWLWGRIDTWDMQTMYAPTLKLVSERLFLQHPWRCNGGVTDLHLNPNNSLLA